MDSEKVSSILKKKNVNALIGKKSIKEIMQMQKEKYEPSESVKNTKAVLAGLSMIPVAGYPASVASSVYDLGTAAKFAADDQWDRAKEDALQGILSLLPNKIIGVGLKGNKITKQLNAIKAMKFGSDVKTLSESPSIMKKTFTK